MNAMPEKFECPAHEAYWFAEQIVGGRDPASEEAIAESGKWAVKYVINLTREPFPAAEDAILTEPLYICQYTRVAYGDRGWPRGAEALLQYASDVHQPKFSKTVKSLAVSQLVQYVELVGGRWPDAEHYIAHDGAMAERYAAKVLGYRFTKGEPAMVKSLPWDRLSYYYQRFLKGDRWHCLESDAPINVVFRYINTLYRHRGPDVHRVLYEIQSRRGYVTTLPMCAAQLASDVLGTRCTPLEPIIREDPAAALHYATNVIRGRWLEAESVILGGPNRKAYEQLMHSAPSPVKDLHENYGRQVSWL